MAAHAAAFHLAKKPRKLSFTSALGVVELDVEIAGVAQPFAVSPVLAALLLPFQEKAVLTPQQLAAATGVPLEVLLRKCAPPGCAHGLRRLCSLVFCGLGELQSCSARIDTLQTRTICAARLMYVRSGQRRCCTDELLLHG